MTPSILGGLIMKLCSVAFGSLLLASTAIPVRPANAADPALTADAVAFGAREAAQNMDLSPSGSKIVMIEPGPGASSRAKVFDLVTGQASVALSTSGLPDSLRWCGFASETQLVCRYGGTADYNGSMVGYSRLLTVAADGSNLKQLGQARSWYDGSLRQFDGALLDWLPSETGMILMAREYVPEEGKIDSLVKRSGEGTGVDRVDLARLKFTRVEAPKKGVWSYLTDGRGAVRLMAIAGKSGLSEQISGKLDYSYRRVGAKDWTPLGSYDERSRSGLTPLAIDAESDSLYVLKDKGGRDALYRIKLDATRAETLIAADPAVDIDNVIRFGRGQRVVGYSFADTSRRAVYFDPEFAALAASLGKAIKGSPQVDFVGSSRDGAKLLILLSGDTEPGRYYVFERATKRLNEIALARPELEKRSLAQVQSITYRTADGATIPAYLTLPPGRDAKNLPTVVLPHGGPEARDEWGFDWLAQFLAGQGYAVLQPNYRGSSGYGRAFRNESAFRNWKTAVSDIGAGARHLASQGIADPQRTAILGWSYGGYAALQGAAVDPSLYKAVVAIAPVTDLSLLKFQASGFNNSSLVDEMVGSGANASTGSPLRNAAAINAPVLLVHGDMDANVGILHSEKMNAALVSAGKRTELIRFKGLDHSLDDSNARVRMLTRIGEFLQTAIGK